MKLLRSCSGFRCDRPLCLLCGPGHVLLWAMIQVAQLVCAADAACLALQQPRQHQGPETVCSKSSWIWTCTSTHSTEADEQCGIIKQMCEQAVVMPH